MTTARALSDRKKDKARARRLRKLSRPLTRAEKRWLEKYESPPAASGKDRTRAWRLRKKDPRKLTRAEAKWLDSYRQRTGEARIKRASASARTVAVRTVAALVRWFVGDSLSTSPLWSPDGEDRNGFGVQSYWTRRPKKGDDGIAIATAEWDTPEIPVGDVPPGEPPIPPFSDRFRVNVRVRITFVSEEGDSYDEWYSLVNMGPITRTIAGDSKENLETFNERPSPKKQGQEVGAIDSFVSGFDTMAAHNRDYEP